MTQILRTLDKACAFLDFDDVHSSRPIPAVQQMKSVKEDESGEGDEKEEK